MGGFNKALLDRKKVWIPKSQFGQGYKKKKLPKEKRRPNKLENEFKCAKVVMKKRVKNNCRKT